MNQVDLFGGESPSAAAPVENRRNSAKSDEPSRLPIPVRIPAWETLLKRSQASENISVVCCTLWTGVCLEVLSCINLGRRWLQMDGSICESPPDSAYGRIIYATPAMVRAWHAKRALIYVPHAGTHSVTFRFGDAPATKPMLFPFPFQEKPNA